jgi:hypothetical protein
MPSSTPCATHASKASPCTGGVVRDATPIISVGLQTENGAVNGDRARTMIHAAQHLEKRGNDVDRLLKRRARGIDVTQKQDDCHECVPGGDSGARFLRRKSTGPSTGPVNTQTIVWGVAWKIRHFCKIGWLRCHAESAGSVD